MLIVEDGTGKEDSESYGSVDGASKYAEAFGRTEWEALPLLKKEIRLRLATQYIETMYEARGEKVNVDQALSFPTREKALPIGVVRASYELATYPGLPTLLPADTISDIESESKELSGLKKSVKYRTATAPLRKRFYVADGLLKSSVRAIATGGMTTGTLQLG